MEFNSWKNSLLDLSYFGGILVAKYRKNALLLSVKLLDTWRTLYKLVSNVEQLNSTVLLFLLLSKYSNLTIFAVLNPLSIFAPHYLRTSTSEEVRPAFNFEIIRSFFACSFLVSLYVIYKISLVFKFLIHRRALLFYLTLIVFGLFIVL